MTMEGPKETERKTPMLGSIPAASQWKRAALMAKTVSAFKETISDDSDEDVDTKQQIKYGNTTQAAWAIFSEYCDNSTIHGIKYLGEKKRPCLERFFWIMVFVGSIYLCATLTMNIWNKWNNNPVIVSFAENTTPVWQIPFPAVTICAETKSKQTYYNFTDMYWKMKDHLAGTIKEGLTEQEAIFMDSLTQVCDSHLFGADYGDNVTLGSKLISAMSEIMPQFNETYLNCKWRNLEKSCDQLFDKFVTDEGLCFSFNSLSPREIFREEGALKDFIFKEEDRVATDWNVEDGYNINASPETFPNRVLGPGARAGLFLMLNGNSMDFDDLCRGPVHGFKIILHTPGEVARASKQYLRVPFDQEVLVSIKPKIITTSEGLRHYEPHRRQCFFQRERDLRYFQIYTQSNCELECLANFTYTRCGCVKFSMPRHEDIPVCGPAKTQCFNLAEDELLLKEFNQGLATAGENTRGQTDCNCLPSCTSIEYEAEISQADFDYNTMAEDQNDLSTTPLQNNENLKKSRVSIFFKEAQFLTSRRSELYGTTDFLANCGGLLGLFMGVSTLSIVEIIYFCTVRLITNLKMRRKKRKIMGGSPDTPKEA